MTGLGQVNFALRTIITSERKYFQKKLDRSEVEEIIQFKITFTFPHYVLLPTGN